MKLAIVTSAFEENINELDYYTSKANNFMKSLIPYGDVFIHTNNPDRFDNERWNIIASDKVVLSVSSSKLLSYDDRANLNFSKMWSLYDKLEIVNYVFSLGYNDCLFIDADEEISEASIVYLQNFIDEIQLLPVGFYFPNYWNVNGQYILHWGYLKKMDFFYHLRDNIHFNFNDNCQPVVESLFYIKNDTYWTEFYQLCITKYKILSMENDLKEFSWVDESPHRPVGRAEGLGWVMAIAELGLEDKLYLNKNLEMILKKLIKHRDVT